MIAYLTPPAVARMLAIRPAKVLRWISRGELRASNVADSLGGRPRWRVSADYLQAFLARRRAVPQPVATRRPCAEVPHYV